MSVIYIGEEKSDAKENEGDGSNAAYMEGISI